MSDESIQEGSNNWAQVIQKNEKTATREENKWIGKNSCGFLYSLDLGLRRSYRQPIEGNIY